MINKTFWFNDDESFTKAFRWCHDQMGPSYTFDEVEIRPKIPNWEIKRMGVKGGGIMIWDEQYLALAMLKFGND